MKMPRRLTQPPNTSIYDVKSSDTVASIALRFDTTPAELSRLNHLSTSLLFPGQTLFVPDAALKEKNQDDASTEKLHIVSEKPSDSINIQSTSDKHELRLSPLKESFSPDHSLDKLLLHRENSLSPTEEISTRYLKIRSKYVTDGHNLHLLCSNLHPPYDSALIRHTNGKLHVRLSRNVSAMAGVVSGVLLVTPQTVMFNPCVSDHLVMDRGRDTYIVRLSLKAISQLTFFEDIAAMVVGDVSQQYLPSYNCLGFDYNLPKPGVVICQETGEEYLFPLPNKNHDDGDDLKNVNIASEDHTSEQISVEQDKCKESCHNSSSKDIAADDTLTSQDTFEKSSADNQNEQSVTLFMQDSESVSTPKHQTFKDDSICDNKKYVDHALKNVTDLDSNSKTREEVMFANNQCVDIENSVKQRGLDMHNATVSLISDDISKDSGISELSSTLTMDSPESHEAITHPPLENRSSLSKEAQQWLGKRGILLSSMSGDEADFSKEQCTEDVMPRPATKYDDHLIYVAIKVHKNYWYSNRTRQNNVMGIPPNRDQKRRQHWFAIPKERVDQFYGFLLHWAPEVNAIASGNSTPCSEEFLDSAEALNIVDNTFGYSPATAFGYEKLSQADAASLKDRGGSLHSNSSRVSLRSLDDESPELLAVSTLISKVLLKKLSYNLPKRTFGHSWELVYSTNLHGISLHTLYRNFREYDNPCVLLVKDESEKVFGAFISESPKVSEGFYGTGESMLFSFNFDGSLLKYSWTGQNNFFIKGSKTSLAVGGGEGVFGLWLDEDLYHGRSHACQTFGNETLSHNEDFVCSGLEAWAFV